jgi:plastocyanin
MTISAAQRREPSATHSPSTHTASSPSARTGPTARRAPSAPDATAALPQPSARHDALLVAFAQTAAASLSEGARDAAVRGKLDAVRDAYAGPYRVGDQTVSARPMFRINMGHNHGAMKAHAKELDVIAARARVNGYGVRMGFAGAADLRKVTQALIDGGHLPSGPPGTEAERIRQMQWEWGIGVDCAAYTGAALTAATGKSRHAMGLAPAGMEAFRNLDKNRHFSKISPVDVRAGDVITLDAIGDYGHNVIVRGRAVADASKQAALAQAHPELSAFFASAGPHHVIEVDSSWGAGSEGAAYGGFRTDTWLYDESTKKWASFDRHVDPVAVRVSHAGPAGDIFHGAYRAKS